MKKKACLYSNQKISAAIFSLILFMLCAVNVSFAQDITLTWDANQESDVAFYNVYFKDMETQESWQEPGPAHDPSASVVSHQVLGLLDTRQYCFQVTALSDSNIESAPSPEICTTVANDIDVKYGTVLSPNGGETLAGGSQTLIDWVDHPDANRYKVRISTNGGRKFWTLQDNVTLSQATVTLPNINSDQVVIKVVGYNASNQWLFGDNSDATLRITKGGT
jgi:hypothetical protein